MKVVCDGDSVAYKAAFSTQYQTYHIEEDGIAFRYLKDCNNWLSLNHDIDEFPTVTKVQVVEPINHSFHIVNKIMEALQKETQAEELIVYLSGETNFRKNIPYPVVYKGGRPEKPIHLPEIRQFLVDKFNAKITEGYEADDAIGIYATANPGCIIASVDKDLRMIPGLHFHLDRRDLAEVTPLDGMRTFYKQMLVGDRVDNIIGVTGIGQKTAEKLIDKLYMEHDMDRVVRQKYKECFGKDWEIMYKGNHDLLKILNTAEEAVFLKELYDTSKRKTEGKESTEVVEKSTNQSGELRQ